jgi:TonB family protein
MKAATEERRRQTTVSPAHWGLASPTSTIPDLERIPKCFGRYEVRGLVGRGAIACVYRALDPRILREVAIKALHPSPVFLSQMGDCRRHLEREAQAAGGLSHPNIVVIYDTAEDYLVMEFLRGQTLRMTVDTKGPLSLKRALEVLDPIAAALNYAHRKGVVHRDVRPDNIMLPPDQAGGEPKLMGFGFADLENPASTSARQSFGLQHYLSPEQIVGGPITPATDVFALAAVAYEILTGAKAFDAPSVSAVIERILGGTPTPPTKFGAGLPPHVDAVLARGLEKTAGARFDTPGDLVEALRGESRPTAGSRRSYSASARTSSEVETQDLRLRTRGLCDRVRRVSRAGSWMAASALAFPLMGSAPGGPPIAPPVMDVTRASLAVSSEPSGVIVWMDGRPRGRTPLSLSARLGSHTIRLAERGFFPAEIDVNFSRTENAPVTVRLQRPPSPPEVHNQAPSAMLPARVQAGRTPSLDRPERIAGREPTFPWELMGPRPEGRVVVALTVSEKGDPTNVHLIGTSAAGLVEPALDAIRTWRFKPARREGVPVPFPWLVTYHLTPGQR